MNKLKKWFSSLSAKISAFAATILVGIGVIVAPAQTVTDTVTWTNPTAFDNGTPLAAADIESTRVQWGTARGGPYNGGQVVVAGSAAIATFARTGTGIGTRCYVLVTKAKIGTEAIPTVEVCKTIDPPPPRPNPPTNVKVE